jgi:hypothetical protein
MFLATALSVGLSLAACLLPEIAACGDQFEQVGLMHDACSATSTSLMLN